MFQPNLQEAEVLHRQQTVKAEFLLAQHQMSISGIRQILGNTFIEMGSRIYGMHRGMCPETAELKGLIRNTLRTQYPA